MTQVRGALRASVAKKAVMAVTGILLFGFVVLHLLGNLQVYEGPEKLNAYAKMLRAVPELLWGARLTLLAAVTLHIWAATSLTRMSLAARPVGYEVTRHIESTYASRTMRWSGVTLALFIVYHLLHFTFGSVHPDFREGDVYHNVVAGFQVWPVSLFYVLAMLALGFHLYHGAWSMLQTLGLSHPRYNHLRNGLAGVLAVLVVIGNISIPVAVLTGFVR
jgi:succinate dehydrogenase / fumarate reductase cytochrome b subunit